MPVTARRSVVLPVDPRRQELGADVVQIRRTGLAYANTLAFAAHYKTNPATYKAGEWYLGMDLTDLWDWPPGDEPRGHPSRRSIP